MSQLSTTGAPARSTADGNRTRAGNLVALDGSGQSPPPWRAGSDHL